ncbi:hypothetical protein YOLOSWAG_320 [Erwinia phage vB_EamM_Yoloswag]|uniref:Uncharacterized protein n=1 Tax=Erwinia phage vB_EamM_Yoloswag TaxID=1958956 RepID=A0A1S6L3Q6_9CAUD|nr:hypothetical protein HOR66_gp320 [Erwinia phage vB_EamM_Yoloswag]AQT28789.1 hypothetical protein YOLOSWAG_320 [Erwinia phage vB_EamM_Yoloswag]
MAKSTSTALVAPTRINRISKKSGSISQSAAKASQMPHDVTITATQVYDVQGFITELTADSVTIRHKRGFGSSAQVLSTFPRSQVIELVGDTGTFGSLSVLGNVPVRTLKGQLLSFKGTQVIATDFDTKEVTVLNTTVPGVSITYAVNETAAAKKYGIAAPTKGKKADAKAAPAKAAKGGKPVKAGKSKK